MKIAICVIARNEAKTIGSLMRQLAAQTLLARAHLFQFVIATNGCSDDTASIARTAATAHLSTPAAEIMVHETALGGKARTWNIVVHELIAADAEVAIFLDADIELIDPLVLEELVDTLLAKAALRAVSGHPVKDINKKPRKSPIDWFSLAISRQSPAPHSINGSLYAARMAELRKIWLPVPTPGEDGLLSAMIHTDGFSRPPQLDVVTRIARPTHYFAAHSITGFFRHERRMTVGTVINGWICEFFWAGNYKENAGHLIRDRNAGDPEWVGRLVASRVAGRRWVLPPRMLWWRLHNLRGVGAGKALARAPFSIAATLLNIWPSIQANRTLKRKDSAEYW